MWSVRSLRPYLYGEKITLYTGHHTFLWILNLADSSKWLARWRLRLAEYDYEFEHQTETTHEVADGVPSLRRSKEQQNDFDDEIP